VVSREVIGLGLGLGIVGSMIGFAIGRRGRAVDPDVALRPASVLLGHWIRDWAMWVLGPLERGLVRSGISPDLLNIAGAMFGLVAGVEYARHSVALGGTLVLLGGVTDILDGRVARSRGLVNRAGEFLDSVADRFAEIFALAGVAVLLAPSRLGTLAAAFAMGGSMLVSYTRAKGALMGVDYRGGLMARAERLVLLVIGSWFEAVWPGRGILLGTVAMIGGLAMITGAWRAIVVMGELRDDDRES
jgi:CDP-diacylglycerol---glycerol-3-phosphate 3-phosphatidyltransferase